LEIFFTYRSGDYIIFSKNINIFFTSSNFAPISIQGNIIAMNNIQYAIILIDGIYKLRLYQSFMAFEYLTLLQSFIYIFLSKLVKNLFNKNRKR
jgi:hypothetical protein